MTAQSANFADLISPVMRKIFVDALALKEYPPIMSQIFTEMNSKYAYEQDS